LDETVEIIAVEAQLMLLAVFNSRPVRLLPSIVLKNDGPFIWMVEAASVE
jgi:hypothetical protein